MPKPYGEWHYKPGDFYRRDERTGFKVRASRQRREWQGYIVAEDVWEARHPQDFVKGVWDNQTVPEPRPLPNQDIFVQFFGPANGYVAEDEQTFYVAEDGATFYVQEN